MPIGVIRSCTLALVKMLQASEEEIISSLDEANPWWGLRRPVPFADIAARDCLPDFLKWVKLLNAQTPWARAVLLFGQRNVGKTVMVYHAIRQMLIEGIAAERIMFCSIKDPVFATVSLPQIVSLFECRFKRQDSGPLFVFLDEVQFMENWERCLNALVDSKPDIRFIAICTTNPFGRILGPDADKISRKSLELFLSTNSLRWNFPEQHIDQLIDDALSDPSNVDKLGRILNDEMLGDHVLKMFADDASGELGGARRNKSEGK